MQNDIVVQGKLFNIEPLEEKHFIYLGSDRFQIFNTLYENLFLLKSEFETYFVEIKNEVYRFQDTCCLCR